MANDRINWTEAMETELSELWKSGMKTAEIAKEMKVGKNSLIGKASRLGLKRRESPIVKNSKKPKKIKKKRLKATRQLPRNLNDIKIKKCRPFEHCEISLKAYGKGKKLVDLGRDECHWPIGDPKDDDFIFCGGKIEGGNYCPNHNSIAYRKISRKGSE